MELEDDKNVLQHLLQLEAEASSLVDGAQAEADRRLAEAEKQCRAVYEKTYSAEVEKLEADYIRETAAIKEEYRTQLESYHNELRAQRTDTGAFSGLARQFLLGGD